MGNSSAELVKMPRSFVLLGELEKAERGNTDMSISFGLVDGSDIMLTDWQCTILGPQGSPLDNRIVSLLVQCPPTYPDSPPKVKFQTKVNFPFVGKEGEVDPSKMDLLKNWKRPEKLNGIEMLLLDLRRQMSKAEYRKLSQPAEGSCY